MTNETANGPGVSLPWAGKLVRIEQVEEFFPTLWNMSLDNLRIGANLNVRTSVLNLVICAPDIETAAYASKQLRELASTHLARVTLIVLDHSEQAPSEVTSWVTLRCFSMISDLMRHCFEQTTLLASGRAVSSIGNIIHPLLKPDLPVYLWWLGDPPAYDDPAFRSLVALSNRVIFDSTRFFHPEQDIYTLSDLLRTAAGSALSDLNWARIIPLRELVIQFFDVAEYRPFLTGIYSLEIEHAAAPLAMPMQTKEGDVSPNPARALLLAGWLKGRLGWAIADDRSQNQHDTNSGTYHWKIDRQTNARMTNPLVTPRTRSGRLPGGRYANISIRPRVMPDMRPGAIALVRLISVAEGKQAVFTIEREKDLDHVSTSVEVDSELRQKRIVNLPDTISEIDLLRDELEITGHDYHFEQTLQEVADLLDAEL